MPYLVLNKVYCIYNELLLDIHQFVITTIITNVIIAIVFYVNLICEFIFIIYGITVFFSLFMVLLLFIFIIHSITVVETRIDKFILY